MRTYPIGNGTLAPRIPREFAALMDALQIRGANTDALLELGESDWEKLLEFCDLAHLTLPLAQVGSTGFPAWVVRRLEQNVADNALRFERVRASYKEAAAALEDAGVTFVVLKGFTQSPEYVKDPRLRLQSDLDLYCPKEQIAKAYSALEKISYKSGGDTDYRFADHVPTLSRSENWKWRGNAYDPEMPVSIELHFCLWNESVSSITVPETEQFWNRRVIRRVDEIVFPALSRVDHLSYFALHILRGVLAGDWLVHHLHELATFIHEHAEDQDFWQAWEGSQNSRSRNLEVISFALAEKCFSCILPEVVRARIDSLPAAQKGCIERFGGSALEVMFRRTKDGKLLQLLLMESWATRQAVVRRAIIPTVSNGPHSAGISIKNRRVQSTSNLSPYLAYSIHLGDRLLSNLYATSGFLAHGLRLWLDHRALRTEFWLFIAVSFFFDLGLSSYFFLFNLFLIARGYSEAQLGLLTGALAAGNLVGAIPAGWLIQRAGLRRALMGCLVVTPAIFAARAMLPLFPLQVMLAFAAGTTLSLWAVCISPVVAKTTSEKQRPFAFSVLFSVGIGVGALGGLVGSRMPGWLTSIPLHFHLPAPDELTLIASCLFAALGVIPATALTESRPTIAARASPLFSPSLRRFLPAAALWGLVAGSFSPFANVFFAVHVHLPLRQIGNIFSVSQLVQVGAVLCAPLIFRWLGVKNGIVTAQFATALCFVVLALSSRSIVSSSVYVALTAFQWMNEPGLYTMLMSIVPEEQRGGASASMTFSISGAQLVAATAAGWAYTRFGYPAVLVVIALIAIVAAGLFGAVPQRRMTTAQTCAAES